mmetsp:Transcript_117118/g.283992  ORF Transcript_117118/g.283992 Transcript_117118/m.283992 type:complete len:244 (+) Transcript_117118:1137-1868(+)
MKSVSAPAQTVLATMRVPDQKSKELCCASRLQKCGFSSFPSEAGRNMTLRPVDPFPRLLRRPLGFLFFRMMLWDDSAQDACPTLCRSSSSGGSVGATLKDLKGRLQVEASERWLVPRTPTSAVAPGGMISDFRSDFNVSRTAMPVASESRPSDDSAATSFWRPHCLGSPPFASLFPQGMVSSRAWMALRRTSTSLCCSSSSSFIPALSSETKLPWTPSSMEYRAPAATLSTLPPLALSSSLAP